MAESVDSYGYDQPNDKQVIGTQPEPGLPPYHPGPYGAGMPPPAGSNMHSHHSSTTVIVQQPQAVRIGTRAWTSGLCSCWDDMSICLCGAFCGCCLATQVAGDMGEHCCVPCCVPGWLVALRLKMRTQENIEGTLMNDCCTVCCCGPCSLCQLAREVKFVRQQQNTMMQTMPHATVQY